MTTALLMLRAIQLGMSVSDMDLVSIGLIEDMYAEKINDDYYDEKDNKASSTRVATQRDFDAF